MISVFLLNLMLLSNAQIFRPVEKMTETDRSYFMAEHFWDGFPFNDTNILHQEDQYGQKIAANAVANYLGMIRYANLETIQQSLVNTLQKADSNERMYRYFVEIFDYYLNDPLSGFREEQWIEPVWKKMLESKWCTLADSVQVDFFLKMAAKNRVGSLATDLDYITIQGEKGKLSELKSEFLLVYFYIPGCQQCIQTREWIESDTAYQEIHKAGILQVLAFYPEKDMNKFHTYKSSIPSTWINARDPNNRSQLEEEEKYQMRGAPTMYLLDKNKKIILKDAREDLLFAEFAKVREKYLKK